MSIAERPAAGSSRFWSVPEPRIRSAAAAAEIDLERLRHP